jgi:hypothetical protein
MRVLIITSCTGEKSVKHDQQLTMTDFRQGSEHVAQRENELIEFKTPAEALYTGQQHKRLMRGIHRFRTLSQGTGNDLELWILSAGYGFIGGDRHIVPYECTFNGMSKAAAREWSEFLGVPEAFRHILREQYDLGIVLLGGAYLDAVQVGSDVELGGPTLFITSRMNSNVLRAVPGAHAIELSKEDTRRFHSGLVAIKGEVGGRLLTLLADRQTVPSNLFDAQNLLTTLASLPPTSEKPVKVARTVVANPTVDGIINLPPSWYSRSHRSQLRYFVPDWDDRVDPDYDFEGETHAGDVGDWSNETYAHQLYGEPITDGILVSRATIDEGRRKRDLVERLGIHRFLRVPEEFPIMGDCGAFSYVREEVPPYTTDDVLNYYTRLCFDLGVSVDHLVFAETEAERDYRYALTVHNAEEFLNEHRARGLKWEPMGAVQGWDPASYAKAARQYTSMGYRHIALGGLVRSSDKNILPVLEAVHQVVPSTRKIHLLGVARFGTLREFVDLGVTSIDSASPLRRAWLGSHTNYLTPEGWYAAIRIPQANTSFRAKQLVREGGFTHESLAQLEQECLQGLRQYANRRDPLSDTLLDVLVEYDEAFAGARRQTRERIRHTLEDRPWEQCNCTVCSRWGVEVLIFRGNNRNRRRGFHNTKVYYDLLPQLLGNERPSWVLPGPKTSGPVAQLTLAGV